MIPGQPETVADAHDTDPGRLQGVVERPLDETQDLGQSVAGDVARVRIAQLLA